MRLARRISAAMANHQLRILLVDDHAGCQDMLAWYLVHKGHWVECVGGAGTALERLRFDGFDVLLTDIWRPDATGWSLLAELKKRGTLPPRVITMGAMNLREGRKLSQAAGAHAHLAKPLRLSELEAALAWTEAARCS